MTVARYIAPARWLHWIVALLVFGMLGVGIRMVWFPPDDKDLLHRLYNLHESTGIVVLFLMLARLVVRAVRNPPPLPDATPRPIQIAAVFNHLFLYLVLLLMPVMGFLGANAAGVPLIWYELVQLPSPQGPNKELAQFYSDMHLAGAVVLIALLAAHLGGAAYHGLIRRDGVVRRIL